MSGEDVTKSKLEYMGTINSNGKKIESGRKKGKTKEHDDNKITVIVEEVSLKTIKRKRTNSEKVINKMKSEGKEDTKEYKEESKKYDEIERRIKELEKMLERFKIVKTRIEKYDVIKKRAEQDREKAGEIAKETLGMTLEEIEAEYEKLILEYNELKEKLSEYIKTTEKRRVSRSTEDKLKEKIKTSETSEEITEYEKKLIILLNGKEKRFSKENTLEYKANCQENKMARLLIKIDDEIRRLENAVQKVKDEIYIKMEEYLKRPFSEGEKSQVEENLNAKLMAINEQITNLKNQRSLLVENQNKIKGIITRLNSSERQDDKLAGEIRDVMKTTNEIRRKSKIEGKEITFAGEIKLESPTGSTEKTTTEIMTGDNDIKGELTLDGDNERTPVTPVPQKDEKVRTGLQIYNQTLQESKDIKSIHNVPIIGRLFGSKKVKESVEDALDKLSDEDFELLIDFLDERTVRQLKISNLYMEKVERKLAAKVAKENPVLQQYVEELEAKKKELLERRNELITKEERTDEENREIEAISITLNEFGNRADSTTNPPTKPSGMIGKCFEKTLENVDAQTRVNRARVGKSLQKKNLRGWILANRNPENKGEINTLAQLEEKRIKAERAGDYAKVEEYQRAYEDFMKENTKEIKVLGLPICMLSRGKFKHEEVAVRVNDADDKKLEGICMAIMTAGTIYNAMSIIRAARLSNEVQMELIAKYEEMQMTAINATQKYNGLTSQLLEALTVPDGVKTGILNSTDGYFSSMAAAIEAIEGEGIYLRGVRGTGAEVMVNGVKKYLNHNELHEIMQGLLAEHDKAKLSIETVEQALQYKQTVGEKVLDFFDQLKNMEVAHAATGRLVSADLEKGFIEALGRSPKAFKAEQEVLNELIKMVKDGVNVVTEAGTLNPIVAQELTAKGIKPDLLGVAIVGAGLAGKVANEAYKGKNVGRKKRGKKIEISESERKDIIGRALDGRGEGR